MMDWHSNIREDFSRFALGLPRPLEDYVLDTYGISLASEYAGLPIKNPFGKASGQLSLNAKQVERDAVAGLGFAVLKTLIAQDQTGEQSMKAWAVPAAKMTVEEITGTRDRVLGESGWTVTWKGRGWSESFDAYLGLLREAAAIGAEAGMAVAPSVKYHLPAPGEGDWAPQAEDIARLEAALPAAIQGRPEISRSHFPSDPDWARVPQGWRRQ